MAFSDQFPYEPSAADFSLHAKIDEELRQCDELRQSAAPLGLLFPGYFATDSAERKLWVPAALKRFEWHLDRKGKESPRWMQHLRSLLRLLFEDVTVLEDEDFERLLRIAPSLHADFPEGRCDALVGVIDKILKKRYASPLPGSITQSLVTLLDHLIDMHHHSPDAFAIAFRLLRERRARVSWVDIPEVPEWNQLLDLADHRWQSETMTAKQSKEMRSAIQTVGRQEVAGFFSRAVGAMQPPETLTGAGMTMLRQMLLWLQADPELQPVDEALYRLCGMRWVPGTNRGTTALSREWIGALLRTLATRPRDRAFACFELLLQNPDTKNIREVATLYEQLFAEVVGSAGSGASAEPSSGVVGVDDFPMSDSEDLAMHTVLDGLLQASARMSGKAHLDVAMRQAKGEPLRLLRAMHERVEWLAQREPVPSKGQPPQTPWLFWKCDLGSLYCRILDQQETTFTRIEDLVAMCRTDSKGWLGISPASSILTHIEKWIDTHGFSAELTKALDSWKKSLFGSASALALRKRVEWLLWFDTAAPINEKACWSASIRIDLRGMSADSRGPWIALLRNISTGTAHEPTKKWLKPASQLLSKVGVEEFQSHIRSWFAPFASGQNLKLTIAGRDVLLALLWYGLVAKDSRVDEAIIWFGTARWKAKSDLDRTARLLPVWIHVLSERTPERAIDALHAYKKSGQLELTGRSIEMYQNLCRKYGREPEIHEPVSPPPLNLDECMKKAFQKVIGGSGANFGDALTVASSSGERYRIGLSDGRIVRESDQRIVRLEIDWSQPPFGAFKGMVDGMDLARPSSRTTPER